MVSCGGTRLPLAPFSRAVITAPEQQQQQQEGGESSSDPRTFVQVGLMGRLSVAASALWNEYTYTNCSLFFSAAELEALKQRCMAPLQGAYLHSYDKAAWQSRRTETLGHVLLPYCCCWSRVAAVRDDEQLPGRPLLPADLEAHHGRGGGRRTATGRRQAALPLPRRLQRAQARKAAGFSEALALLLGVGTLLPPPDPVWLACWLACPACAAAAWPAPHVLRQLRLVRDDGALYGQRGHHLHRPQGQLHP